MVRIIKHTLVIKNLQAPECAEMIAAQALTSSPALMLSCGILGVLTARAELVVPAAILLCIRVSTDLITRADLMVPVPCCVTLSAMPGLMIWFGASPSPT
jgi:hypothetical protein